MDAMTYATASAPSVPSHSTLLFSYSLTSTQRSILDVRTLIRTCLYLFFFYLINLSFAFLVNAEAIYLILPPIHEASIGPTPSYITDFFSYR